MSLESATYISDLVGANPTGSDNASQGDDHLRLLKTVLQATLPNATRPKYFPNSGATKTSSFSTANTDDDKAFQCDATLGAITVTLSTTTIDGLSFFFQKIDSSSNAVVLDPTSTVLINGASTLSISKQWSGVKVIWLNTYGAWLALPSAGVVPYYSGGQDIPFSDIAPSANAKRILGAATATDFSEQTIATVLEWLGTAARGDLILRGASAFAYLNIGTTGKFLKSDGTDAAWQTLFAVLSDMQAGTSTTLVPTVAVQKDHPAHPKAHGRASSAGALQSGSYGITSIAKNSTGNYTVTLSTALSAATPTIHAFSLGAGITAIGVYASATTITVTTNNDSSLAAQDSAFGLVVYGAQ